MAGNANFDGLIAFVAEQSLKRKFTSIWPTANPLLTLIKAGGNFNKGFTPQGLKALIPINFAEQDTPADGVADASELTPITPYGTSGFTQAEYEFAHYRAAFYIKESERQLIAGSGVRGNLIEGKTQQVMDSFKQAVANDLVSANAGTRSAIGGIRYALSTTNSPGNISQVTYSAWQAGVKTGAGPFSTGPIDDQYDRITALGRGAPDICLLSYTATNNVYGRMRDQAAALQLLTQPSKKANFGFPSFSYLDMDCIQENKLGTALGGSAAILRSNSWYLGTKTDMPELDHAKALEGTDAMEYLYKWWLFMGCGDPAGNSLITDFS